MIKFHIISGIFSILSAKNFQSARNNYHFTSIFHRFLIFARIIIIYLYIENIKYLKEFCEKMYFCILWQFLNISITSQFTLQIRRYNLFRKFAIILTLNCSNTKTKKLRHFKFEMYIIQVIFKYRMLRQLIHENQTSGKNR